MLRRDIALCDVVVGSRFGGMKCFVEPRWLIDVDFG